MSQKENISKIRKDLPIFVSEKMILSEITGKEFQQVTDCIKVWN